MDDSFAINEGLHMARKLLLETLDTSLPVDIEFLDLLSPQFISGQSGLHWRQSGLHWRMHHRKPRQLASGLSYPIGFKNSTDSGVKVAADAIVAAQAKHAFLSLKDGSSDRT